MRRKPMFWPRLAWDGLRKNSRLSVPYLLTCVCMVCVFYILSFLSSEDVLALIPRGKSSVRLVLNLGRIVILLFSLIFLFYTGSFLVRRRAREFGLYNVLGMGRRSLVRVISWENGITFAAALSGGLLAGIVLSKIAELGLVNLMGGEIDYRLRLDVSSVLMTALCYAAIFALIWLSAAVRVARSSAVSLMKAENVGEKPPKGSRPVTLLGVLLLAAAYTLAVSVDDPVSALLWFFAAVLMVILATYLLMITGSVRLCRVLQGRKDYYYRADHFVSVSSMAYRMKRNGAGLASICVIATMVLVMLSSSACLWFGADDSLRVSYPRDIEVTLRMTGPEYLEDETLDPVRELIASFVRERGGRMENVQDSPEVSGSSDDAGDSPETAGAGTGKTQILWRYDFDTGLSDEENARIDEELEDALAGYFAGRPGLRALWVDSRAVGAADFYGTYGSLFFIGILLSAVFMLAAVLIIYYKQVSEGYEDAKRFDIMQKVGMTKQEIRASIRSQLLTVFALPLAFAGLHLVFAFPMIRRVLMLFSLYNVGLFVRTTLISFAAFALFYAAVYRLTSGVYYRIVSGAEAR